MFIITNNNIRNMKSRIFPPTAPLLLVNGYGEMSQFECHNFWPHPLQARLLLFTPTDLFRIPRMDDQHGTRTQSHHRTLIIAQKILT